jgi:hypothetical protein
MRRGLIITCTLISTDCVVLACGTPDAPTDDTVAVQNQISTGAPAPTGDSPPKQALDACKSLAEGASCTVTLPERAIDGTCRKGPDGEGQLACAPAQLPLGGRGAQ